MRNPIGRNYTVDPLDLQTLRGALNSIGYYKTTTKNDSLFLDESLIKGIEYFQEDFDLDRDGVLKPFGETEKMLGSVLGLKEASVLSKYESKPNLLNQLIDTKKEVGEKNEPHKGIHKAQIQTAVLPVFFQL